MSLFVLLNRRILGFRIVELAATLILTAMILTVYMAKTGAGDKRDDIDRITQQIQDEQTRIHLLKAEVANEEQPERLTHLASQYLNMAPIAPNHEIDAEALADIAQPAKPAAPAQSVVAIAPTLANAQSVQPANYAGPPVAAAPPAQAVR